MSKININLRDKKIILVLVMMVLTFINVREYQRHIRPTILVGGYVGFANLAVMIIGSLMIIIIMILIIRNKNSIEQLFCVAALSLGIAYIVAMPIFTVPDEKAHFDTTYEVSNKMLGIEEADDPSNIYKRKCDSQYYYTHFRDDIYTKYEKVFSGSSDKELIEVPLNSTGKHMAYLLPAVGITVSRLMGLDFPYLAMSGMILNLLLYVVGMTYAIKRTPVGKNALISIGLFPIVIQQARSYSYDVSIIVASSIIVALAFAWQTEKKKKSEIIIYLICSCILLYVKTGVYAILILLPWLLNVKKSFFTRKRLLWIAGVIGGLLVATIGVISFTALGSSIKTIITTGAYVTYCDTYAWPVMYYIEHPLTLISILRNTIEEVGPVYKAQILGDQLGWLEVPASSKVMLVMRLIFICSCVKSERESYELKAGTRVLLLMMSVIIVFLSCFAMLLFWTPAGYMVIQGIQGRYFLPAVYPAALAIGGWKKPRFNEDIQKYLVVAMAIISYCSLLYFMRYASSFSL